MPLHTNILDISVMTDKNGKHHQTFPAFINYTLESSTIDSINN